MAWRWDCTHHQYAEWAQVQPPRSLPQEWGVVAAWLDWRTFLNQNMAAFVRWQHDLIKARDPHHPTMTNIFALSGREVEMALDPWLMAAQCDVIGYDLYPGIRRETDGQAHLHQAPEYISMFLDMGRSTALHAGAEFWLPELESGPINGWALGPDHTTTPADITRYNLEALAHGAKAILYQGYREWPCIPIHWGALANLHGRPTARYTAAQAINRMVGMHADLFQAAQPPRAQIAIYDDTRNNTLLHGMAADDLLKRCQRGAYSTFWRAGHPVEFVNAAALGRLGTRDWRLGEIAAVPNPQSPIPNPYNLLLLPAALLIDAETAAVLRSFVHSGGTLIAFAKCAWVDGRGWSWADQPGAGLDELFGVQVGEIERIVDCRLQIVDWENLQSTIYNLQSPIPGYWHRQPLTPLGDAQALAHFADGSAAIVRRTYGQGQTFFIGTHLDAAALESESAAALLLALAESAGLRAPLTLDAPATIDAHLLLAGERRLIALTNNGAQTSTVRVGIPNVVFSHAAELLQGSTLTLADNHSSVAIELAAWGGAVLLLD